MKYELTEIGKEHFKYWLKNQEVKRKDILVADKNANSENLTLPTEEDILDDIAQFIDKDGDYFNCWGLIDNYDTDPICLKLNEDFVEKESC